MFITEEKQTTKRKQVKEEWGEYHREPKLKGVLSYYDQCIVDWDEENLKNPSAYSWEGDNYSKGYSPHLIGWSGETGECVRLLSKTPSGGHNREPNAFSGSTVLRDLITQEGPLARSLSKTPSSGGHNSEPTARLLWRTASGVDKKVYELPAIESLGVKTACIQDDAAVLNPVVCTGQNQVVMVVTISDRRTPCL